MIYDRAITISTGASRKSINWQNQAITLSALYKRLEEPGRSTETLADYLCLPKGQQDDLKDVGGFVAGAINGPRRKAGAVAGRDIITLDLDTIPSQGTDRALEKIEALSCGYCVYSTRKHRAAAPRLRVLLPLDRTVSADEYEPIARKAAEFIGMDWADPTTFEPHRLMYWPSLCADGEYVYRVGDKAPMSADGMLALYQNWRDTAEWPAIPGAVNHGRLAAKQGDPETKHGVVGAFCRVYDVERAMEAFLSGVYEQVEGQERYTFLGGSTVGGAVLYDNGKFLYSHHATDPCSGQLVNAFDLVRIHKFSDLDFDSADGTPTNRLPSYKAMVELAAGDNAVSSRMLKEKQEAVTEAFSEVPGDDWQKKLQKHPKTGLPLPTIDNICIILENDRALKGMLVRNVFSEMLEVLKTPPWLKEEEGKHIRRVWKDADTAGLCWYLEKFYGITGRGRVEDAIALHGERHTVNEILAYLNGLDWDGTPRLDTIYIDYLGADDTSYVRTVSRKSFVAAVARIYRPGIKFDCMTVLVGKQGAGKSTLLRRMAKGWFTDNLRTFEGKDAAEIIQGVWLVEVGEMGAFRKSDDARIKQFLSQEADRYRAAYGRHVSERKRKCVFFGTVNDYAFLRDHTGNRRFWPVDVDDKKRTLSPFEGPDDGLGDCIDQIWAEAVYKWKHGESLYLPTELWESANEMQEEHREVSVREALIQDFLKKEVPEDWNTWDLQQRRVFWSGGATGELKLRPRDRVCALEIWCELFEGSKKEMRIADTKEINAIVAKIDGWEKARNTIRFGYCGPQKGFRRGL